MDQIIPIAMIEAKAKAHFARGLGIDEHGFNDGAAAIPTYEAAWKRCADQAEQRAEVAP